MHELMDINHIAPQIGEWNDMGVRYNADGTATVRHAYIRPDGVSSWVQKTIPSQDKYLIAQTICELKEKVSGNVSDYRYVQLSQIYREKHSDGGMKSVYDRVEREIGKLKIDRKFAFQVDKFVTKLAGEGKAVNTISNYKSVIQRVLNHAYKANLIKELPIHDFGIERKFRDRVWRGDERIRFWNTVEKYDSHLRYALILCENRPIRKMDIAPLTLDNLKLLDSSPHIRFRPKKTGNRKQRDTYLPLLDKRTGEPFSTDLWAYLHEGIPKGCPYLFPRIGTERNGIVSKLKPGEWKYLGDPDKHYNFLRDKAGIADLHLHDWKHIALTNMIKAEGWSRDQLKDLGIQYSDRAIDVYLNLNAEDALRSIAGKKVFAATKTG